MGGMFGGGSCGGGGAEGFVEGDLASSAALGGEGSFGGSGGGGGGGGCGGVGGSAVCLLTLPAGQLDTLSTLTRFCLREKVHIAQEG